MKKLAITLSHEDFSKLVELCEHKTNRRNKSREIGWLIKEEWERLQEEEARKQEPMKTTAEAFKSIYAYLEKKRAGNVAPCDDAKIIQFPAGQFMGSA